MSEEDRAARMDPVELAAEVDHRDLAVAELDPVAVNDHADLAFAMHGTAFTRTSVPGTSVPGTTFTRTSLPGAAFATALALSVPGHGSVTLALPVPGASFTGATFTGTIAFPLAFTGTVAVSFTPAFAFSFPLAGTFFPGFLALAGRTLLVGGGRTEGDGDEPGETGDEDGVEPTFSLGGVCDHLDALLQGGMVSDTRRHSCDGGCRKKFSLHAEEGASVVEALGGTEPLQGDGVAPQFAVGLETRDCDPDEGIEPVHGVHQGREPVEENVAVADVLHFVHDDVAEYPGLETALPIAWEDEISAPDSEDCGGGSVRPEKDAEVRGDADPAGDLAHEGEDPRIPTGNQSGAESETTLSPAHGPEEKEGSREPDPEKDGSQRPAMNGLGQRNRRFRSEGIERFAEHEGIRIRYQCHRGGNHNLSARSWNSASSPFPEPVPDSRGCRDKGGHEEFQTDDRPEEDPPARAEVPTE